MDAVAYTSSGRCLSSKADFGACRGPELPADYVVIADNSAYDFAWKQRFEQAGIDGLDPLHKGSEPRVADAALQTRIDGKPSVNRSMVLRISPAARWQQHWV